MKSRRFSIPAAVKGGVVAGLMLLAAVVHAEENLDYSLDIQLDPVTGMVRVQATIELPPSQRGEAVEFLLSDAFTVAASSPEVTQLPASDSRGFQGINGSSTEIGGGPQESRLCVPEGICSVSEHDRDRIEPPRT